MARYNPTHQVKFDLARGQLTLEGRLSSVLTPVDALLGLCQAAGGEALRDFGSRLGTEIGSRAVSSLEDMRTASAADVIEHLGGHWALLGLGSLGLERWGNALVLTVAHAPKNSDELLAAVAEAALRRSAGREAKVLVLHRDQEILRLLVVNPDASDRVRAWLSQGRSWGDILTELNAKRDSLRGEA